MHNCLPKTLVDSRKLHRYVNPFVRIYKPLVMTSNSSNIPFICKNMPFMVNRSKLQLMFGFTLIELVVTMAVAAILITIAVPNMRTFIQNGRLNTQINDLIGDLSLARSEAIKRRTNVGICVSTDGATCAGGGNWEIGRAIFVDSNNSNSWDPGEPIMRFRERLAGTNTLTTDPAVLPDPIIFRSNGASSVQLGGPVGLFNLCDERGASKGKQVSLNSMGQASVTTNPPGAC